MESVEEAYEALSQYIIAFIGTRCWDSASCKISIYDKMASGSQWLIYKGSVEKTGRFTNDTAVWEGLDAAIFIRDDLLQKEKTRIWGLEFTLYPDGTFSIKYDYSKPDNMNS